MIYSGVFTNGDALGTLEFVRDASNEQALWDATNAALHRLREAIERDQWALEGEPEVFLARTPEELPPLGSLVGEQAWQELIEALDSGEAAAIFATQRVTVSASTPGLIGVSLIAQTKERLALAGILSHPGESGRAREEAIRQHLLEFLPGGLSLETGFVIDALGAQSRQIDLILYFGDYYPVFRINGLPIVPIEAVIAVFEVKANVSSRAVLADCYEVLATVKRLDRSNRGRNYLISDGRNPISISPDRYNDFQLQVLGAVVAERSVGNAIWFETTQDWCATHSRREWPNFFVSASAFVGTYQADGPNNQTYITANTTLAARLALLQGEKSESPLGFLTHEVLNFARVARRVDYSPMSYLGGSHNLGVETRPFR